MKKKPFLSLLSLILISSIGFSAPTFAKTIQGTSKKFWTIPELIELKEENDRERELACNGNSECEENLYYSLLEQGGIYSAIDNFSNMHLLITSINPSASTVRVLFHDKVPMDYIGNEVEPAVLDEIFIAWFSREPDMFNNYYAKYGRYKMEKYFLFSDSASNRGRGWFPPNQEVELPIDHADALLRSPHYIFFTMEGEHTSVSGMHDYSNCVESPFFEEGMECRMIFDDEGGFDFLPFWPGSDYPVEGTYFIEEEEEGYGGASTENGNTEENIHNPESPADPVDNDPEAPANTNTTTDQPTSGIALSGQPETGEFTRPTSMLKSRKNEEFPWCLALIITLSGIFIFWWFYPTQKGKKYQKNPKKSLDKKYHF